MDLRALFASPAIALGIGIVVGLLLLAPVVWGYRFLVADRVEVGLAVVTGSVFAGMIVAVGALFGYRALAPAGLVWFGPALVGGFVVGLGAFALRVATTMFKSGDERKDDAWRS